MRSLSFVAHVAFFVSAVVGFRNNGFVEVKTVEGSVRGLVNEEVYIFKGIPFAASTGGPNRWQPPQAVEPWGNDTALDATQFGPGCTQPHHNKDVPNITSEDCLNLNVYTPQLPQQQKPDGSLPLLPVLFFIHGGSFAEGSNQGPLGVFLLVA